MSTCNHDDCDRAVYGKGLCNKHWQAARRRGELSAPDCGVDGCCSPALAQSMCIKHYLRTRRYGDPQFRKAAAPGENARLRCLVDDCQNKVTARGYCNKHDQRIKSQGDPNKVLKRRGLTPEQRKQYRAEAQKKYQQTPHGRLRSRFNASQSRVRAGAQIFKDIPKADFLVMWSATSCAICGEPLNDDKTLDHKVPLSRGGDNSLENMQMAHLRCNQRKSNKLDGYACAPC